jgi:hypothetical protein
VRPVRHLAPGRADDPPAGGGEALVSLTVDLEALAGQVPLAAVSLEDHALLPPHEVRSDRRPAVREDHEPVGVRVGNPEGPRDRQEKLLVLAPGGCPADVVLGQNLAHGLGARTCGVAGEPVLYGLEVEQLEDLGLVEGPL